MRALLTRAASRWEQAVPDHSLRTYRCIYCAIVLAVLLPRFRWIADLPDDIYDPPPGPFSLFDGFPSAGVLTAVEAGLVFALFALLFGIRANVSAVVVGVLLIVGSGFSYGVGKIDHPILLAVTPLLLSGSSWGSRGPSDRSHRSDRGAIGWRMLALALVVGFALATAALPKAATGWPRLDRHVAREEIAQEVVLRQQDTLVGHHVLRIESDIAWELADYLTMVLEGSPLLLIFRPRLFRMALCVAAVFHGAVLMTMGISFAASLVAYAAFFAWPPLDRRRRGAGIPAVTRVIACTVAALAYSALVFGVTVEAPLFALRNAFSLMSAAAATSYLVHSAFGAARCSHHALH